MKLMHEHGATHVIAGDVQIVLRPKAEKPAEEGKLKTTTKMSVGLGKAYDHPSLGLEDLMEPTK